MEPIPSASTQSLHSNPRPSRPTWPALPIVDGRRSSVAIAPAADEELLAGRYRLRHPIGRGAIGEVYLADDAVTGGPVALKLLPAYGTSLAATRERVESEATLNRLVEHANVVRLLDVGHAGDGRPFVVTEALVGETLGHRLRECYRLSIDGAIRLVREAARGLAAVHRAAIVHRDVKPDNLFLCDERIHGVSVKVLDFGFATRRGITSDTPPEVLGTLEYLAPEQALAEPVDARSDIYSLGVVLFRALTGELPFDACARRGIVRHQLESRVPPPSWLRESVEADVDTVVSTATRKHPRNRYATMDALLDDLDALLAGRPVRGVPIHVDPDEYVPTTDDGRRARRQLLG